MWLNRPEVHNAFNDVMISELIDTLVSLDKDPSVRIIILRGKGKSFCAGADLNWMKKTASYSQEENLADAFKLDELMFTLNSMSKPTIAVVHGSVFGGGVGLTACCDIAIAHEKTQFALSEVRIGLIPAVISPYVISAMGARICRRLFLTGERFSSLQAHHYGLIHEIADSEKHMNEMIEEICADLLKGGSYSQREAKSLIHNLSCADSMTTRCKLASKISEIRQSPQAKEGLTAFFEKRAPNWGDS